MNLKLRTTATQFAALHAANDKSRSKTFLVDKATLVALLMDHADLNAIVEGRGHTLETSE